MTAPTNVTNLANLIEGLNSASQGWFAPMLLIAFFAISFFSLKFGTTPAKAGAASSWVTFIVSIGFFIMDITTAYVVILCFFATVGCGIASYFEDR